MYITAKSSVTKPCLLRVFLVDVVCIVPPGSALNKASSMDFFHAWLWKAFYELYFFCSIIKEYLTFPAITYPNFLLPHNWHSASFVIAVLIVGEAGRVCVCLQARRCSVLPAVPVPSKSRVWVLSLEAPGSKKCGAVVFGQFPPL